MHRRCLGRPSRSVESSTISCLGVEPRCFRPRASLRSGRPSSSRNNLWAETTQKVKVRVALPHVPICPHAKGRAFFSNLVDRTDRFESSDCSCSCSCGCGALFRPAVSLIRLPYFPVRVPKMAVLQRTSGVECAAQSKIAHAKAVNASCYS